MTVKELIEHLQTFPQDYKVMDLGGNDINKEDVCIKTWEHTNYPYDLPSYDYICIL